MSTTFSTLKEGLASPLPLTLAETESSGRGLFATCDIEADREIFSEHPLLRGPSQRGRTRVCGFCSALLEVFSVIACQKCKLPLCSERCQDRLKLSDFHGRECPILVDFRPEDFSNMSDWLAIFRALILKGQSLEKFKLLESQLRERSLENPAIIERNKLEVAVGLQERLRVSETEVSEAACRIDNNAFRIDGQGTRGVYALASMINHDCRPNARVQFDREAKAKVIAKRKIAKGEQVTITYCSPLLGTVERAEKLRRSKLFVCKCRRCLDPTEFGTYMSSVKCQKCEGHLAPRQPVDTATVFECEKCGFSAARNKVDALLEAIREKQRKFLRGKADAARIDKMFFPSKLFPSASLVLEFKNDIINLNVPETDRAFWKKKADFARERIEILSRVDDGDSRLLGFLHYKLHHILINEIVICQKRKEAVDDLVKEMEESLKTSIRILREDSSCPSELRKIQIY